MTTSIAQALAAVMGEVQSISKDQRVSEGPARFNFRGVDDVMQAVGPALRKHGVIFAPTRVVSVDHERYTTAKGSQMDGVTVVVEYTATGPSGDFLTFASAGQAADAGDKATSKALSVAYRTVLLQALCVPTGDPDPDSTTHERAHAVDVADPRAALRGRIKHAGERRGLSVPEIADDFASWSQGVPIAEADADMLTRYLGHLGRAE